MGGSPLQLEAPKSPVTLGAREWAHGGLRHMHTRATLLGLQVQGNSTNLRNNGPGPTLPIPLYQDTFPHSPFCPCWRELKILCQT